MSTIERFFEDVVADMRRQLAGAGDPARRVSIEDRISFLTDYRLAGIDEKRFERLLATLSGGRSPVSLSTIDPCDIAGDLARRWSAYRAEVLVPSRN